jgi:hypothetical protein
MSPNVVWIVAEVANGDGPPFVAGVEVAIVCSSRVGRSLKMSRSPVLSSLPGLVSSHADRPDSLTLVRNE